MSRPHASSVDAQDPWGAGDVASPLHSTRTAEAQPEDDDDELDPAEIQEKERLVKYVFELIPQSRDDPMAEPVATIHRDFTTKQDGLKALMERISSVNKETQKIKSGNETLQTYIDNLTRNNAQAAVSGGGKR